MECSLLGTSVHGISQARILEWVAVPFSKGSSRPKDRRIEASSLESPALVRGFFTTSTSWEASPHTEIHKDLCPPFFRKNKISYNFFLHHQRGDWVPSKLLVTSGYPYKLLVTFVLLVPLKPECMCFEHISAVSQMSKRNLPRTPSGQRLPALHPPSHLLAASLVLLCYLAQPSVMSESHQYSAGQCELRSFAWSLPLLLQRTG